MVSVNVLMEWLEKMISSETKIGLPTTPDDLKESTKASFLERTLLIESLAKEKHFDMDLGEVEGVCERYISTLYCLLNKLNSIIQKEVEEFSRVESITLSQGKKTEHTVPALSPDVLSVGHQGVLTKVFQFIVTLGIVPHLSAGVGPPIAARSKFGNVISSLVAANPAHLQHNITRLLPVIRPANLRAVFMTRHLGDLLAALMQIQNFQITTRQSDSATEQCNQSEVSTSEQYTVDFRKELEDVISKSYQPLIVRELLILQMAAGPKTPVWMRAACGHYLTRILVSDSGVKYIIAGMITSDTDNWQKFQMVGRVIATPPKQWTDMDYYQLIAPQVLALLNEPDQVISRQYGRVCAALLSAVGAKHPLLMESLFWKPLTSDLSKGKEKQEKCLQAIYKVICCAAEPQSMLLTYCLQILPDVFEAYVKESSGIVVTDSRLYCEELLSTCMSYADSQHTSAFLHRITFSSSARSTHVDDFTAEESRTSAILFCVNKVKDTAVIEAFFVALLEKLTTLLSKENGDQSENSMELSPLITRFRIMTLLASLCDTHSRVCLQKPQCIIIFVKSTLEHFLSTSSHAAHSDTETLSLSLGLLTALMSGATDVKLTEADVLLLKELNDPLNSLSLLDSVPSETRELSLNIRVAIATQGMVWMDKLSQDSNRKKSPSQDNSKGFKSQKPSIEVISSDGVPATTDGPPAEPKIQMAEACSSSSTLTGKSDSRLQQLSSDGMEQISTTDSGHMSSKLPEQTAAVDSTTLVPSTESCRLSGPSVESHEPKEEGASSSTLTLSGYREALMELGDPLIPVKGHALIQLTKYIQRKDKETIENRSELQKLLIEHLSHSDSYIYLSAISALTALADVHPAEVLPALCEQYRNNNIVDETRLKVGEVITKSTLLLGDFAPLYSDVILPTVLIGCKSSDEFLRASSLVNLGELCKLLQYSMGNHVYEIVECLSASLVDHCQSSRKGAAHSIALIVCELNRRCFDVLGADCVRTLYKSLKACLNADNDDVTVHHCSVAVEALDKITKQLFTPDSKLEKRIFVLDPPPCS